jgi:hypothetical protein
MLELILRRLGRVESLLDLDVLFSTKGICQCQCQAAKSLVDDWRSKIKVWIEKIPKFSDKRTLVRVSVEEGRKKPSLRAE